MIEYDYVILFLDGLIEIHQPTLVQICIEYIDIVYATPFFLGHLSSPMATIIYSQVLFVSFNTQAANVSNVWNAVAGGGQAHGLCRRPLLPLRREVGMISAVVWSGRIDLHTCLVGPPPKNCRKGGAGVSIGYGVSAHLIHYHKFSPQKTFHATSYVF